MKETTRETVLNILNDIRPDVDFTTETGLITEGILESFDLLTLIASLEDEIGMEIGNRDVNVDIRRCHAMAIPTDVEGEEL